ncbi:cytochrome P450 3A31 isoform X2 [Dermacentor silvarum]|uniref:cytochrome P450 3A31 isoform X2 n=1 Tax=Dermacentor silvarum TaxID=543639 RepID=UPI002101C160|nr:cytochrome P450 3A31 isoform X2 [Dermacentor silvarum]
MFAAVCLAVLSTILYSLYRWRKRTFSVFKELGIPGPEPNLIFGNLLEIRKKGMGLLSREWTKKYGDIVGYYNGVMPGIILRDVELIKRTFIQDFQYFTGRQVMASVSKNIAVNEVRISRVHGDDWRHLKKIVLPAFKTANIKKAVPLMQGCVEECFRAMDRKLAGSDGCVEVFEPYCIMATDFGLQFFAGARMDIQRDDAASLALYKAARGSVGQFGGTALFFLNLLPDSRLLHRIIIAMQSIFSQLPSDEMVDRMLPIINHRRANPDPTKEDVLQLLLNSEKEERMSNGKIEGRQLSSILLSHPVELRTASNTCIFIVAGIDNIAAPLAFASYLLSEHQDVQDKVRAEVQALLEKEGQLTYDGLGELTYLGQVLSESLRLYPSLPGSIRRICDEDYEYNGVRILKGMNVSVPTLEIHYDPTLWPEPKKFDPERFSKANKDSIQPMSYFPYGFGPRRCIATALSQMELTLTLALLVMRYRLLPSGKYKDEPPNYTAATLLGYPKEGVWVKLQKLQA